MSRNQRSPSDETFQQRLDRLRLRIDALPAERRSHLFELADAIQRQHQQLKKRTAQDHHDD